MECHDVQQLLAFVNRPCGELDAPERDAMREHMDKCPDCSAIAQAERRADDLIGPVLRAVPVPSDLRARVMKRLASEKPSSTWKWSSLAALILIAVGGSAAWVWRPAPELEYSDIQHLMPFSISRKESAEEFFRERGLKVSAPEKFDFQYIQDVELVDLQGRRVAKLTFSRADRCMASVLILPRQQFRTDGLVNTSRAVEIWRDEHPDFIYVVVFAGDLSSVLRPNELK